MSGASSSNSKCQRVDSGSEYSNSSCSSADDGNSDVDLASDDIPDTDDEERNRTKKKRRLQNKSANKSTTTKNQKKKQKTEYKQKFRSAWKKKFAWLRESRKGDTYFRCSYCMGKDLKGGLTAIKRHESRSEHQKNVSIVQNMVPVTQFQKERVALMKKVKENEIRLSMFILKHDLPVAVSDHLVELIKTFDRSSKVLQTMKCDRTKCTHLMQDVVAQHEFEELVSELKDTNFSLMVDETTDRVSQKHLVLVVRYYSKIADDVVDSFLALLEPKEFNHTALYNEIVSFFKWYSHQTLPTT